MGECRILKISSVFFLIAEKVVTVNSPQLLKKLPTYLKSAVTVTDEYIEGFIRANNTFLYQLVFDPLSRSLHPLNPYPPELEGVNLDYAGEYPFIVL